MLLPSIRHSEDDNNRGINEIIGSNVWDDYSPQPPSNVFPMPSCTNSPRFRVARVMAPAPGSFVTPALINDSAPDADKYA